MRALNSGGISAESLDAEQDQSGSGDFIEPGDFQDAVLGTSKQAY